VSLRPYWWRAVCASCQAESWVSTILPDGPTTCGCPSCLGATITAWVKSEETLADPASMNLPPQSFENSEQELRTNALVSIANSLLSLERLLENYL
jgi:hypothetical protein